MKAKKKSTTEEITKEALAEEDRIRNAFKENGIAFAVPTVQVSGDGRDAEARAAAARVTAQRSEAGSEPAV